MKMYWITRCTKIHTNNTYPSLCCPQLKVDHIIQFESFLEFYCTKQISHLSLAMVVITDSSPLTHSFMYEGDPFIFVTYACIWAQITLLSLASTKQKSTMFKPKLFFRACRDLYSRAKHSLPFGAYSYVSHCCERNDENTIPWTRVFTYIIFWIHWKWCQWWTSMHVESMLSSSHCGPHQF